MATKTESYSNAFYAHCLESSKEEAIEGEILNVWKGFIGRTCRELNIPNGMERRVVRPLEAMGCIRIIERGVGNYPTTIILAYPPTEELWNSSDAPSALTQRRSYAKLVSDVEAIKKSLGGVSIADALIDLDKRLKAVESKTANRS